MELQDSGTPVAMCFKWRGSATYARLDAFCRGAIKGMHSLLATGSPLVLVNDGDIGGLIGLHCHSECRLENPVISVDGILLNEFDYIDIGALLEGSGAVPVVVKSLVFPDSNLPGRPS
jgi:ethanolamine utilization protein EutA